mgnify:CR=1 FL=1
MNLVVMCQLQERNREFMATLMFWAYLLAIPFADSDRPDILVRKVTPGSGDPSEGGTLSMLPVNGRQLAAKSDEPRIVEELSEKQMNLGDPAFPIAVPGVSGFSRTAA